MRKHKTKYTLEEARRIVKKAWNGQFKLLKYTSVNNLIIKNKNGISHKVSWSNFITQHKKPSILSAIDRNEAFRLLCAQKHDIKYDYSQVNYKNSNSEVIIICTIHGKFKQSPNSHLSGHGCPKCGIKKTSEKRKLSIDSYYRLAKKRGGRCLETISISANTPIAWKCFCGNVWKASYSSVKAGSWCLKCANNKKRLTFEDYQNAATLKGGICLITKYEAKKINNQCKVEWECKKGHKFEMRYSDICQGHWCPKCANNNLRLTFEDYQGIATPKGGICLVAEHEIEKINSQCKVEWECEKKHKFKMAYGSVQHGHWCPKCAGNKRLTFEDYQGTATLKGGICLATEHEIEKINSQCKVEWECGKSHKFEMIYSSVQQGKWCPKCAQGKSQACLQKTLESIFGEVGETVRPNWLKNPKTKRNLEIDIYFPNLKVAIEYQGAQHFYPVDFAGKGGKIAETVFKETQARDKLKRKLIKKAKKYVDHYVEFPYTEELTEENVRKFLIKNGIKLGD